MDLAKTLAYLAGWPIFLLEIDLNDLMHLIASQRQTMALFC